MAFDPPEHAVAAMMLLFAGVSSILLVSISLLLLPPFRARFPLFFVLMRA
jgi:hypothetical protein